MASVLVLGGYGAVGSHAVQVLDDLGVRTVIGGRRHEPAVRLADRLTFATPQVVDTAHPEQVTAAAQGVDLVINCSGRRSVALLQAIVDGGAHVVDISAEHAFHRAAERRLQPTDREVLCSVGIAPGLTNLAAAEVSATPGPRQPIEIVVLLGVGEAHGRASRDWTYALLGRSFADTTGRRATVRNLTGGARRRLPDGRVSRAYRADFSDQHVLTEDLGTSVVTRLTFDSTAVITMLALVGHIPGAARLLRATESAVPWSRLGTDRWMITARRPGEAPVWAKGRNQSRAAGIVAALAASIVLGGPVPGVTHLHRRTTLAALAPQLQRYGVETGRGPVSSR